MTEHILFGLSVKHAFSNLAPLPPQIIHEYQDWSELQNQSSLCAILSIYNKHDHNIYLSLVPVWFECKTRVLKFGPPPSPDHSWISRLEWVTKSVLSLCHLCIRPSVCLSVSTLVLTWLNHLTYGRKMYIRQKYWQRGHGAGGMSTLRHFHSDNVWLLWSEFPDQRDHIDTKVSNQINYWIRFLYGYLNKAFISLRVQELWIKCIRLKDIWYGRWCHKNMVNMYHDISFL